MKNFSRIKKFYLLLFWLVKILQLDLQVWYQIYDLYSDVQDAKYTSRISHIFIEISQARRKERIRRFAQTSSNIRTDAARLMQPCSDVCFRWIHVNAIIGLGYSVIARHVGIFFAFEEHRDYSVFKCTPIPLYYDVDIISHYPIIEVTNRYIFLSLIRALSSYGVTRDLFFS